MLSLHTPQNSKGARRTPNAIDVKCFTSTSVRNPPTFDASRGRPHTDSPMKLLLVLLSLMGASALIAGPLAAQASSRTAVVSMACNGGKGGQGGKSPPKDKERRGKLRRLLYVVRLLLAALAPTLHAHEFICIITYAAIACTQTPGAKHSVSLTPLCCRAHHVVYSRRTRLRTCRASCSRRRPRG